MGFLLLLVVLGTSSVGAGHIHGSWLARQAALHVSGASLGAPAAGSDLDCPLCLTMHAALPFAAGLPSFAGHERTSFPIAVNEGGGQALLHFASFSRPPPSLLSV